MIYKSFSEFDTFNIGKKFARNLKMNDIIFFYGDMGLGKTVFTRGILSFFGKEDDVSSPTFSIMNEYDVDNFKIYHFDMYRINSEFDLHSTGFFDFVDNGVIIVEWSENILKYFSDNTIDVKISMGEHQNERIIDIINKN